MSRKALALCAMLAISMPMFIWSNPVEAMPLQSPDLTLAPTDIAFSDDSPVVGQTITVWARVHNIGDAIAYNVPVYFYDSVTSIGIAVISMIEPNLNRSTYTMWTPRTAGLTNITVVIDPLDQVKESNESNNVAWRDINVLPRILPDLWIEWIAFSNDHPKSGETVTVSALIHNGGLVEAKDVITSFFDNNTLFSSDIAASIGPGQSFINRVQWTARASVDNVTTPRVIEAFVDPDDRIEEISESNNTRTTIVFVGRPLLPDLTTTPEGIYLSTGTPVDNQTVTLYARISNLGNVSASGVEVLFLADSRPIGIDVLDSVPGGLFVNSWIDWAPRAGFHTITVSIDPNDTIKELDKSNNIMNKDFIVDDYLPFLSFTNISLSNSKVIENMTVTVYADVVNTGRDAAYGLLVRFYDRHGSFENEIGSQYLDKVSPNGSRKAFTKWFAAPPGNHTIIARADSIYTAGEFDRRHAEANATLYVWPSLPDLQVLSVSIYPFNLEEGQIARVNATVRNHGVIEARDVNAVLIDNGDVVASLAFTISPDPTGNSKMNLSFNHTANTGIRNLTVFLDPQNRIQEYDEKDNSMSIVIEVAPRPVTVNWFVISMVVLILGLFAVIVYIWRERLLDLSVAVAAWCLTLLIEAPLLKGMADRIYARAKRHGR